MDLNFYAIRNEHGEFLENATPPWKWTKDVDSGKIYRKPAPARGIITTFANENLTKPAPDLIIFKVGEIIVENQEERLKVARARLREKKARESKEWSAEHLRRLQSQRDELDKQIREMEKKNA